LNNIFFYRDPPHEPTASGDTHDPVEKPAHYNQGGIECIDYIRQVLGEGGFKAYCLGNCIKYLHRHDYKGKPEEDLRKAQYYLNAALSTLKGDN
jgi:hypothetical protein